MSLYRAIYKCQLCGKLITTGKPAEVPPEKLPELLGKVIQNQQFVNNPWLYQVPFHIPHQCQDGSGGLAQFAGFQIMR